MEREGAGLRVAFETLGCRSNYADTTDLQAALVERGGIPCAPGTTVDAYVINTCTVTDGADRDVLKLIRRAKSRSPEAKIVVTGCMAGVGREKLLQLGLVDAVIEAGRRRDVIDALFGKAVPLEKASEADSKAGELLQLRRKAQSFRSELLDEPLSSAIPPPGASLGEVKTRARFHLRIQEGCENFCTFCIIPKTRGPLNSREAGEVLNDVRRLSSLGFREIVLTGTHIGGYGLDMGGTLLELLKRIEDLAPPARIRLSSIDPNDLSTEIVDLISGSNVFCGHLHICVQAFSDRVLKRMNRRYRMREVISLLEYVKERLPHCGIGSDVIAGFPGESREELEQAEEIFLGLPFSYLHVFPFSERAGTPALRLDGQVAEAERKQRAARWRSLAEQKKLLFLKRLVGRPVEAVVEKISSAGIFGTTREYASVKIAANPKLLQSLKPGEVHTFVGRAVDSDLRLLICE